MIKVNILQWLLIAAVVALAVASPAFAEFKSQIKATSSGKGEGIEMALKAGGAMVKCLAFKEASSKAPWAIKGSKGEAEKGEHLIVKLESWGECKAEATGLKGVTPELGKCEFEFKQIGEQAKVVGTVLNSCVIKVGLCEITIGPEENKELKETDLYDSGEASENLIVEPMISGLTTKAGSGCKADGIESSKSGTLKGSTEEQSVAAAAAAEYTIRAVPEVYNAIHVNGVVQIKRVAGVDNQFEKIFTLPVDGNEFFIEMEELEDCLEKVYGLNATCTFGVMYGALAASRLDIFVTSKNGVSDVAVMRGS
jgi:hypothetical protein